MISNSIKNIFGRFTLKTWWIVIGGAIVVSGSIVGYRSMYIQPKVISPTAPALGVREVSNTKPVVIAFNHPVNRRSLKYQIHPDLAGTWKINSHLLVAESTLTFTPTVSPELDTRYTIELSGIKSIAGSRQDNYLLSFQTDTLPTIKTISPVHTTVDILPDAPIVITMDKEISDSVVVAATLTPEVVVGPAQVSGKTVTFTHADQFQKGTGYTLNVSVGTAQLNYLTKTKTANPEQPVVLTSTFTTIAAPGVASFLPQGSGVDASSAIQLKFQQPMEHVSTEAAFSITPTTAGTFSWTDDLTLNFAPKQPLTKGQLYTVALANTAKGVSGFTPEANFSFTFTTIGAVTVTSWLPGRGATNVDLGTAVSAAFNQEVSHTSAESKFSIAPTMAGTFTWNSNTISFHPSAALAYGTTYTATIAAGVQTVKGLDSVSAFSSSFKTRNQTIMLSVPAYRQDHVYSCMISAARSALAFRGVSASESSIISKVGRDTTPWSGTWGGTDGRWGDPEAAIVGPLDNGAATSPAGKKTTNVYWGYGSHWQPISRALSSYGVANEVHTGMTVQQLAQSIADGNPIIIWWVNGIWPSYAVNWKTPSGKLIHGVNGLHVQVVRGFTGSVSDPISFTMTDSGYGYPGKTYDIGTFKAKWKWFGNAGIIVK